MKIVAVDPFYLKMPDITTDADGTQDTLAVRVRTDEGIEGWGECDASPLVSLATYCCPMSHGNIINIRQSLIGEVLGGSDDILRLHKKVLRNALDIQQIDHAYSGTDIALWDIVGQKLKRPVYQLLEDQFRFSSDGIGYPKIPYASVLFGDTPETTFQIATRLKSQGFKAAKFGWGPMGKFDEQYDIELVESAREGMGKSAQIMIDAGVVWGSDYKTVYDRAKAFSQFSPTWLEEPLAPEAIEAYGTLSALNPPVPIAAGEGSATFRMAEDLILHGRIDYVQIDVGRVSGITTAARIRQLAEQQEVQYVNHTFKSHLSLAASLHVFATNEDFNLLEYPADGSELSQRLTTEKLEVGSDGQVRLTDQPGIGVKVDLNTVREFLAPVKIEINGTPIFDQSVL
ncbi:TPA: mandelate racemase/muconate lactonizing enzyme family protein [Candidatus Poribacteria bacterium]|nr:mandelate racemase/muconate lactonizing enzyme family protein [Candidatus Poribacteria bacterium]